MVYAIGGSDLTFKAIVSRDLEVCFWWHSIALNAERLFIFFLSLLLRKVRVLGYHIEENSN
jgi:hypothetical protein